MIFPKDLQEEDLLEKLKVATQAKPPATSTADDFKPAEETTADFTPAAEPEQQKEPEPAPAQPSKPETPAMSKAEQADLLIGFTDGLQCLILPWAYQQTIFTASEREQLKDLKRKIGNAAGQSLTLDAKETNLFSKYSDYKELADNIPFAESEIEMIKNPMIAVMEKYNWNAGPEGLFAGALMTVMAPRLMPLFSKLTKF